MEHDSSNSTDLEQKYDKTSISVYYEVDHPLPKTSHKKSRQYTVIYYKLNLFPRFTTSCILAKFNHPNQKY